MMVTNDNEQVYLVLSTELLQWCYTKKSGTPLKPLNNGVTQRIANLLQLQCSNYTGSSVM